MLSPKRHVVSSILVSLLGVSLAAPLFAAPGLAGASAPGLAIEGVDRARLLPPAGARVEPYRGTGYALRVEASGEVTVEVDASPLGSRSRYRPSAESSAGPSAKPDPVARLARSLVAGTRTHYAATSRVLGWIARHVDYELDRAAPQDAASVLERRSGYCTGVARLAVELLDAAGLEAREVAGWVGDDTAAGVSETGGFHRWIEVLLPDVGWVMSDPLVSHHYVPATYVRLASETVAPGAGMDGLLLERRDAVVAVDLFPSAPPGVRARRNSERRLAAALRVAVERGDAGLAVLEGPAVRFRHSLVDGETTFVGLEPGTYQLRLLVAGAALERSVELVGRERTTLFLEPSRRAPASSAAEPRTSAPSSATTRFPNSSPQPGDRRDF